MVVLAQKTSAPLSSADWQDVANDELPDTPIHHQGSVPDSLPGLTVIRCTARLSLQPG